MRGPGPAPDIVRRPAGARRPLQGAVGPGEQTARAVGPGEQTEARAVGQGEQARPGGAGPRVGARGAGPRAGCGCARAGAVRWRAEGAPRSGTPTRGPAANVPMFRCSDVVGNRHEHRNIDAIDHARGGPRVPRARFVPTRAAAGKLIGQRSEHPPQNALSLALRGHPRRSRARLRNNAGPAPPNGGETAFASAAPRRCAASETPKRNIDARRARGPRPLKSPGSRRHVPIES